jgi:predicted Zn-dependent protease
MLKPHKKITRKEIKRDPFLETVDRLEYNFEKNKKTYLNIALAIVAGVVIINFLLNKQSQKEYDSNSTLGIALVAYENADYENAKFQFETISSEFAGTSSANVANYYLGKISYDNGDFNISEKYLNKYLDDYDTGVLAPGAIKMLSDISMKNNKPKDAISILDRGVRLKINNNIKSEFKLSKTLILMSLGDNESAQKILSDILSEKNLSADIKRRGEELVGMM